MISLNKIVNVNFEVEQNNVGPGSYRKTLLMSSSASTRYKEYSSLAEVEVDFISTTSEYKQAKIYFDNGGQILVIGQIDTGETLLEAVQAVEAVFTDFIFVAFVSDFDNSDPKEDDLIELVTNFDSRVAPNKKIALIYVIDAIAETSSTDDIASKLKAADAKSCVCVYREEVHLVVAAYFSSIDLNDSESIKDFTFTQEATGLIDGSPLTDATYDILVGKNYVVYSTIGSLKAFFNGNTVGGNGIETVWGTIALENDVQSNAFETVADKQYLTDQGLNNVVRSIKDGMQRYVTNGLISPDTTYLGETQKITYNGQEYTTIRKGQTLSLGYLVFTVPMANISVSDRAAKKLPPITVYVNARGSIRKVEINGEVRE